MFGQQARAIRLLKDREGQISHPLHYITFSNMSIVEPYPMLTWPRLEEFREVLMPPEATLPLALQHNAQMHLGPFVLMELDESVPSMSARLFVEILMARFMKDGFQVSWVTGPDEDGETVKGEMKALAGREARRLRTVMADPAGAGYRAEELFKVMARDRAAGSIEFINLMAMEDFAVTAPVEFERLVNVILRDATQGKRLVFAYGHSSLSATRISMKYAQIVRRLATLNGFLFWRSVRPLSPLYIINIQPERGRVEFVEMK